MTTLLPTLLMFAAGAAVALGLARLVRAVALRTRDLTLIGGLGGVMGQLKGHLLGAHHHMPGMVMPAPGDAMSLLPDVLAGGIGGAVLVLLVALFMWLMPFKG